MQGREADGDRDDVPLLDGEEYRRWRESADDDVAAAEDLRRSGRHAHACFWFEQAAEKGLKALLRALGEGPRSHGLRQVATELRRVGVVLDDDEALVAALVRLERHYLPSRYPDALREGTPSQGYTAEDGRQAAEDALSALDAVDAAWAALTARSSGGPSDGSGDDPGEREER